MVKQRYYVVILTSLGDHAVLVIHYILYLLYLSILSAFYIHFKVLPLSKNDHAALLCR